MSSSNSQDPLKNGSIFKLKNLRAEIEKQLPDKKKELVKLALDNINLKMAVKKTSFDQESGVLFFDISIDNGASEKFAYKDTPQQVRRDALTSPSSFSLKPEFFVSDSGHYFKK